MAWVCLRSPDLRPQQPDAPLLAIDSILISFHGIAEQKVQLVLSETRRKPEVNAAKPPIATRSRFCCE